MKAKRAAKSVVFSVVCCAAMSVQAFAVPQPPTPTPAPAPSVTVTVTVTTVTTPAATTSNDIKKHRAMSASRSSESGIARPALKGNLLNALRAFIAARQALVLTQPHSPAVENAFTAPCLGTVLAPASVESKVSTCLAADELY